METSKQHEQKAVIVNIKYKKASKFKARSELMPKYKTIIQADVIETEEEDSKTIDLFITINEIPN
jgi:hypothetical protein